MEISFGACAHFQVLSVSHTLVERRGMRPTLETTVWRKTEGTGAKCEKAEKILHRGEAGGEQGILLQYRPCALD